MASRLKPVQNNQPRHETFLGNEEFKYKMVKYAFVTKCINHVKDNQLEEVWPCTYEQFSKHKECILEGKDLLRQSGPKSLLHIHKRLMKKYDVIQEEHNLILVTNDEHRKRVVDIFLLFDIIYQAHINSSGCHLDFLETQAALGSKHYVPQIAVEFFLAVCNVCQINMLMSTKKPEVNILQPTYQQRNERPLRSILTSGPSPNVILPKPDQSSTSLLKPIPCNDQEQRNTAINSKLEEPTTLQVLTPASGTNVRIKSNSKTEKTMYLADKKVFINFIKMEESDGKFNYILIYMDTFTKYTLLRPLVSVERMELSMVLFKIFADFGVPYEIICLIDTVAELERAVHLLNSQFYVGLIKLGHVSRQDLIEQSSDINIIGRKVRNRLIKWNIVTRSKNWAIGCYIIQLKMNKEKTGTNSVSPFEAVFSNDYIKNTANIDSHTAHPDDGKLSTKQFETKENENKSKNITEDIQYQIIPDPESNSDIQIFLEKEVEELEKDKNDNQEHSKDTESHITTEIIIEDEDSLDAFRDEQVKFNSLQDIPVFKRKKDTFSQFEKSFETFANENYLGVGKSLMKIKRKRTTTQCDASAEPCETLTRKTSSELEASDSSSEINKQQTPPLENNVSDGDLDGDKRDDKCHVCGREFDTKQRNTFLECLECHRRIHSLCSSTTYKQRDQNICLSCMFKDGVPEDSLENFSEMIICDKT